MKNVIIHNRLNNSVSPDELDDSDPLHFDMKEDEWLNCACCNLKLSLTAAILISVFFGVTIGVMISLYSPLSNNSYKITAFIGNLWLRSLKLLVIPLIALIMVILPSRVDNIGVVSKQCITLYLFTSLMGATEGTLWAWTIKPGYHGSIHINNDDGNIPDPQSDNITHHKLDAILNIFYSAIPENIVVAVSNSSILGIIIFCLFFGVFLRQIENDEKVIVLKFCSAILKCIIKAIIWIIWAAPLGVFSLIVSQIGSTKDIQSLFTALGVYVLCAVAAHICHLFIFYPLLYWLMTRQNGWKFLKSIYEIPWLGFAIGSSSAVLPRSLMIAQQIGISKQVYQFTIPLGSTINMDGAATGFPIFIAFIAQLNNIESSFGSIIMILLLSIIFSIGAAPIANSGIIYLTMLLGSVGLQQYEHEAITVFFVTNWLCGKCQTAVNVASDLFIAKICD